MPPLKKIVKVLLYSLSALVLIAFTALGIAYAKQDELLAEAVNQLNTSFKGKFEVDGSHISPFENFPYISIDLDEVRIYEAKDSLDKAVINVHDVYVGFDLLSIISGSYDIKKIKLSEGTVNLIQHDDGNFNLINAFDNPDTVALPGDESEESAVHLELQSIELVDIDLLKTSEVNKVLAEVYIEQLSSSFSMSDKHIRSELNSTMLFNLILDGDTSFLHDKHLSISTGIDYDLTKDFLDFLSTELLIEKATFLMEGSIDVADSMNLDLRFSGKKPNFDLFLALAPPELDPVFKRYDNGGQVYFDALVQGRAAGSSPHVEIDFGCKEAFVENTIAHATVNDLYFEGHFTNGPKNDPSTMSLVINDFSARPETGTFTGAISVENFDAPDIEMKVNSDFNLGFLAEFLNIEGLEDVSGRVILDMNFHDIIDIDDPSKAIERLNESYYTELTVEGLRFKSPDFHLPLSDINIHATMDGHAAIVDQFTARAGNSDISLTASISDLPAILHHTSLPVEVDMQISSQMIDIMELSKTDSLTEGIDEQISDFTVGFRFESSARAFTESPYLPLGEFFITKLHAQLTHYPHELHDFNADVVVDSTSLHLIDFTGMIDKSDFHFDGKLSHYDLWFADSATGTSQIDFNLRADLLQLTDLFSYGGANYVPEDYRTEEFKKLKLHGLSNWEYRDSLRKVSLQIDHLSAHMQEHGITLENFGGRFAIDSATFTMSNFGGKVGRSEFTSSLLYQLNGDSTGVPHRFSLSSPRLDFDQLFSYIPPEEESTEVQTDHEAGFNVFELPFANMAFAFDIGTMNYHRYLLDDFKLQGRMQRNHYVYVDTLSLKAAGGSMQLNGYFNGSNPDEIYFSPNMELSHVDLDKILFKFDNFGQDQLVSDNLHGQLSGSLRGKVHMHRDLIPIIDDSELFIDIEVVNGSLNDFAAFDAMSSYFTDKNLSNIRFDTLRNTLRLQDGELIIPSMNINSTLGYFEVSGRQGLDLTMNYDVRIPLKVIAKAGVQKLFGNKNRDNSEQVDEIQYRDESKRTNFITVNISGTADDYNISLGKGKDKKKEQAE